MEVAFRTEEGTLMKLFTPVIYLAALFLLVSPLTAQAGFFNKGTNIRNEQPMAEFTAMFERKTFVPEDKKLKNLTYFWFQPAQPYPEGIKFPLVLVLHGATGNSYAASFLVEPRMQTAYPAFIVVPVLPQARLWAGAHPEAAKGEAIHDAAALIKSISGQYPVDTSRIYIVGCSDGGTGTFGAVTYYPDIFAGAVAISGSWNPEYAPEMATVPIVAMHGAKDTVIPPDNARDTMSLIKQYGGQAFYYEFPNEGHNCPSEQYYTSRIWDWLFAQKKIPAAKQSESVNTVEQTAVDKPAAEEVQPAR